MVEHPLSMREARVQIPVCPCYNYYLSLLASHWGRLLAAIPGSSPSSGSSRKQKYIAGSGAWKDIAGSGAWKDITGQGKGEQKQGQLKIQFNFLQMFFKICHAALLALKKNVY